MINLPHLTPTGRCWCGCGKETSPDAFFAQGHDKIAEAALVAAMFGGQVHQHLHAHGFGAGHSVLRAAVKDGHWERCTEMINGKRCWYAGTKNAVDTHIRKHHPNYDPNAKHLPGYRRKDP